MLFRQFFPVAACSKAWLVLVPSWLRRQVEMLGFKHVAVFNMETDDWDFVKVFASFLPLPSFHFAVRVNNAAMP